ncbi:death domain-containing protein CRADD-like [Branchiostoma floridae]|uniref:Death domain-containing protein CRADD-like n=1 Tax=Branchiostoma floridae TaxID=7739 RepID=A0A9J7L8J3_BRAFL|nr:death domain-containing protein CRADD-like [Branchiostoma floridae]XP_035678157.1 death domain-containing protein CRADD-like [Branchiostoma floridae]
MEQRHQKILKKKYKDLTRDLRPDDVMDHLIQEDILDFTDIELVRAQSVTKLQVEKLLAILLTRGPRAFGVFLESLEERYQWLYNDLKKADEESTRLPQQPGLGEYENTSTSEARHPVQETEKPSPNQPGETCVKRPSQPGTQTRKKAVVQGQWTAGGAVRPLTDEDKVARKMANMQLSNQHARLTVPPEVSSKRVTEKQLNVLAGKLGKEWENLAIHLDLTQADVDRCKADHVHNTRSQIFAMLMSWRARTGAAATVGALIHNLEDFGDIQVAKYEFLTQTS